MEKMYFIVETTPARPITAEKDIVCWMLVTKKSSKYEDTYTDLKGSRNLNIGTKIIQKEKFHITRQGVVTNGFHTSMDSGPNHLENNRPIRSDRYLIKCAIPQGAVYFKNEETKDYISNEIIFGI